jgi:hypothetical protein
MRSCLSFIYDASIGKSTVSITTNNVPGNIPAINCAVKKASASELTPKADARNTSLKKPENLDSNVITEIRIAI